MIDALVAEDHLPREHAQQVARQERRDQEQQEHVLALRPRQREVVRERVGERATISTETISDIFTDFQNSLQVDGVVHELAPGRRA